MAALIHDPVGCVGFAAVRRTARGASARGSAHRRETKTDTFNQAQFYHS